MIRNIVCFANADRLIGKTHEKLENDEKWTIVELNGIALDQNQKEYRGIDCTSVGVRSHPLIFLHYHIKMSPSYSTCTISSRQCMHSKFREFIQERS